MATLNKEAFLISAGLGALPADDIEFSKEKQIKTNTGSFEINEIPGWVPGRKNYVQRQDGQGVDNQTGSA